MPCPAGRFGISVGGSMVCGECGRGTFSATLGSTSCSPCPLGFYSDLGASVQCTQCPANSNTTSPGATSAGNCTSTTTTCPAGKYLGQSPLGVTLCLECARGFFSLPGAVVCSPCPSGTYTDLGGSAQCTPCPAGYTSVPASASCSPIPFSCPAGSYCPSTSTTPLPCPTGSFSLGNVTMCSLCPAGSVSAPAPAGAAGAVSCAPCVPGTASPTTGSSELSCPACPLGTYAAAAGAVMCTPCPAGSKCMRPSLLPEPCAAGKFAPIASILCTDCPAGTYGDKVGMDGCPGQCLASPGFQCLAGAINNTGSKCPDGFTSKGGSALCEPVGDREYLLAVFAKTGGATWTRALGWGVNSTTPACALSGVTCSADGRVVGLDLANNNLTGFIPVELGALGALVELRLSNNRLQGSVPASLASLTSLARVNLCGNNLTGDLPPAWIAASNANNLTLLANLSSCQTPCAAGTVCRASALNPVGEPCPAGFFCPANTVGGVTVNNACPAGTWSSGLAASCNLCPAGRWGSGPTSTTAGSTPTSAPVPGATTPICSGNCTAAQGFQCLPGSTSPLGTPCPSGSSSTGGSALCLANDAAASAADRLALGALYAATNGGSWLRNLNWNLTSASVCTLAGVTCNSAGRVATLDLSFNNLTGFLPASLSTLDHLVSVNLCGNNLVGDVPPFLLTSATVTANVTLARCGTPCAPGFVCPVGSINPRASPCPAGYACPAGTTGVAATNACPPGTWAAEASVACSLCPAGRFSNGGFSPSGVGATSPLCAGACVAAPGLQCLPGAVNSTGSPCPPGTASAGNLTSCLPVNSVELAALGAVYAAAGGPSWRNSTYWNQASVSVCRWFGVTCDASVNTAPGASPVSGAVAPSVVGIELAGNGLVGTIADAIGSLPLLTYLNLANNSLTGPFPATVSKLGRLLYVTTCGNDLSGVVPATFAPIRAMVTLAQCGMGCVAGYVCPPGSLSPRASQCPAGRFSLGGPNMTIVTECPKCPPGRFGSEVGSANPLCSGSCSAAPGFACPEGSTSSAGVACPEGSTSTGKDAPCTLTQDLAGLLALYTSLRGPTWTNGVNWAASPQVPMCNFTGVTCSGGRVVGLELPSAGLTGVLPDAIGSLNALVRLNLANNSITGVIPAALASITTLTSVNLCRNQLQGVDTVVVGMKTVTSAMVTISQCGVPCVAGYACPTNALTPTFAPCPAGAACPQGSTTPTVCTMGKWAPAQAQVCSSCRPGYFGNVTGLQVGTCSGECTAAPGFACGEGSMSPAGTPCPAGTSSRGGASTCAAYNSTETSALATVLRALGAPVPTTLSQSVCTWPGVACTGDSITGLDLSSAGLKGVIAPEIGLLTSLTSLQLSNNQLTGTLPVAALLALRQLAVLNLCNNSLSGSVPPELAAVPMNLKLLSIGDCSLPCAPGYLCNATSLSTLGAPCPAGSACPAGSTTSVLCRPGSFAAAASSFCQACPRGFFADKAGQAACPGVCAAPAGSVCLEGATSATGTACTATLVVSNALAASLCAASTPVAEGSAATDALALYSLFTSAGGANWTVKGWPTTLSTSAPGTALTACTWQGVTCDSASSRVVSVNLAGAGLRGPIPDALGNLTFLTSLTLSNNQLMGTIPTSFSKLSKLSTLALCNNSLDGVSPTFLTSVVNVQVSVSNCGIYPCAAGTYCMSPSQLTPGRCPAGYFCPAGSIQPAVCAAGNFSLAQSSLCQQCPVGRFGNTVGANQPDCTGACVASVNFQCLAGMTASTGVACPTGTVSPGGVGAVCAAPTNSDEYVLRALYTATGGKSWRNSAGWTGTTNSTVRRMATASVCTWAGVVCNSAGRVTGLLLANNNLTGTIPAFLSALDALSELQLGGNALSGSIPSTLASLPLLRSLNLCGNNLEGDIPLALQSSTAASSTGVPLSLNVTLAQCGTPCAEGFVCPTGSIFPRARPCPAGYSCPTNTTTITPNNFCPPGTFSQGNASACIACPPGRFGATSGAQSPQCSGNCTAQPGFTCPANSTNPAGVPCPQGTTSTGGAALCDQQCAPLAGGRVLHISTPNYTGPVTATCVIDGENVCGDVPQLITSYAGVNYYAHLSLLNGGNFVVCDGV